MRHFEKNPRKISKKELQQLRADLRELGDLGGFVHNLETDEIVGGNQRSEAIPGILSGKLTPVITQTYDPPNAQGTVSEGYFEWEGERFKYRAVRWDAATARRANIRANKAGGVWDFDTLAQWDFDELKGWGFDADFMQHMETGAAWLGEALQAAPEPEPGDAEAQLDRAAELQEVWQVQPGELFELGAHKLICGDCTDAATVARLMGGEKADITFTSPPYNLGENISISNRSNSRKEKGTVYEGFDDNLSASEYLSLLVRFTRNCMAYSSYVFVNIQQLAGNKIEFIEYLYEFRNHFADMAIWHKTNQQPAMAEKVINSCFEYIVILSNEKNPTRAIKTAQFRGTFDNVYVSNINVNEFASIHGAAFPLEFASRFISAFSNDICLEPFAGLGTVGIACQNLNRRARMVELSPSYCAVILQRFQDAFPGLEIRRYPVEE